MIQNIVIVGAGQAAASVATRLRKKGYEESITIIGNESTLPYQRPPLSKKYLNGEMEQELLLVRPAQWYDENQVNVVTDTEVVGIDTSAKELSLSTGSKFPYDKLVLTTGSSPIRLPAAIGGGLQGVYTMRDLSDANAISPELAEDRHVLIVGGGYIGLEAASVARSRGLKVTLVEMAERILGRVACTETAEWFRNLHTEMGVEIREGVGLKTLTSMDNERVSGALLSDGSSLSIDFVIVGIGIRPNSELAEDAGLDVDNGIAVDDKCRTSNADIFAAGDCASFVRQGQRIRLESVQNAGDQGDVAADNILGDERVYDPLPRFWSDQYDSKLQIIGLAQYYDRIATRAGKKPGSLSSWYFNQEQLVAVDAMNDPISYVMGTKALSKGIALKADDIADAEFDIGGFIKNSG